MSKERPALSAVDQTRLLEDIQRINEHREIEVTAYSADGGFGDLKARLFYAPERGRANALQMEILDLPAITTNPGEAARMLGYYIARDGLRWRLLDQRDADAYDRAQTRQKLIKAMDSGTVLVGSQEGTRIVGRLRLHNIGEKSAPYYMVSSSVSMKPEIADSSTIAVGAAVPPTLLLTI